MKRASMRLAAATLFAALPLIASADPTADQAAALRTQLRDWAAGVVGSDVAIPDKLIDVAPEADHYRVEIVLGALPNVAVAQGGTISAAIYPAQAGRWRFDDLRFASPSQLAIGKPGHRPAEVTAAIAKPQGSGVVDPSFATASHLGMTIAGYAATLNDRRGRFETRVGSASGQQDLTPASNGRLDLRSTSDAADYASHAEPAAAPPLDLAAERMGARLAVTGIDPDKVIPFVHALIRLAESAHAGHSSLHRIAAGGEAEHRHLGREFDPQLLREAYLAFRGIATGGEMDEAVQGLRIDTDGRRVGVERLGFGGGVATPDGTLAAHLAFALNGISASGLPPDAKPYLPRHFEIVPSISGINLAGLDALILAATAPPAAHAPAGHADVEVAIAALMAHGIVVGLDKLAFDFGPADFAASGKLTAYSPQKIAGGAEIKATGFDQLVQDAMKTPALGRAVPVLAIMRSLARPEGDALVWSVRLENSAVTVNGHDLAGMFRPKGPPDQGNK